MVKSFGSTLTALGMIGALTACASTGANAPRSASIFGERSTRPTLAWPLAPRPRLKPATPPPRSSSANAPSPSAPRTPASAACSPTLFASGRFASAEAAYKDSLSLVPNQPQLVLKLALVRSPRQECRGRGLARCRPAIISIPPTRPGPGAGRPAGHRHYRPRSKPLAPSAPTPGFARTWPWPTPCRATGSMPGSLPPRTSRRTRSMPGSSSG